MCRRGERPFVGAERNPTLCWAQYGSRAASRSSPTVVAGCCLAETGRMQRGGSYILPFHAVPRHSDEVERRFPGGSA